MYAIATNPRPHQVMQSASIETGWLHPDSPQHQPTTPHTKYQKYAVIDWNLPRIKSQVQQTQID